MIAWEQNLAGVTTPLGVVPDQQMSLMKKALKIAFDEKGPEDCIKEGYTLTSCPEGKGPNKVCMYDERYFEYL